MLVDNISDFSAAMQNLDNIGSSTSVYTLNSHGCSGHFSIGSDDVNKDTDVSSLKEGLTGSTVFISACKSAVGDNGTKLLESFSKQTGSLVIGSLHNIPARYSYDGSDKLSYKPSDANYLLGINVGNDYKISGNGSSPITIYNVSIDKSSGIKWNSGNDGVIKPLLNTFNNCVNKILNYLTQ